MGYRTKFSAIASCAIFGMICSWVVAAGQPNSAAVEDDTPVLEAVIVTAERRPQPLHDVPVSITALTGEELENSKIASIVDMSKLVPGLTVTQASTGQAQLFIRGIGTDIVGAGLEDAVAVYIDGVYPESIGRHRDAVHRR